MVEVEPLAGGGVNEVVRVGATVRRPTGAWSPLVHELLGRLRAGGFTAAPSVHEVTADGFEVLDFLPGDVGNYPLSPAVTSAAALRGAAALLRAYHDHTTGFAAEAPRQGWMMPARDPVEVICHGDFAPYNCVLRGDEVVGVIDFDAAHPGPRVWDIAYAVYRWAPMTAPSNPDGFGTAEEQAARVRAFCDAYGLGPERRAGLVDTVIARLRALVAFMRAEAAAGNAAFARHLAEGHDRLYLTDIAHIQGTRDIVERALR